MTLLDKIPMPDPTKWGDFSDILQNIMQNRMKGQELAETGKYHQGSLTQQANELAEREKHNQASINIQRQQQDRANRLEPLTREFLKARMENQRAQAKQRDANASTTNGLTKANISRNQALIQNIDNVSPLINSLKESDFPGQTIGKYFSPNEQAAYKAKTSAITDSLLGALGLPKTNESLALVHTMVTQHPFESRDAYKTRLEGLMKDLSERKIRAKKSIKEGLFSDDSSSEKNEDTDYTVNENGDLVPR